MSVRRTRNAWVALVATLAFLGSACSSPTAPGTSTTSTTAASTPTPTPTGNTASISSLSLAAQAEFTIGSMVRRMPNNRVVKIRSAFSDADTLAGANGQNGLNNWPLRTGLTFVMAAAGETADITITNEMPSPGADIVCGDALPNGNPAIAGGSVRIAYGLSTAPSECNGGLRSLISHEIGHVLGFGHSPDHQDEMSPHPLWGEKDPNHALDDAGIWYYIANIGATIIK